MSGVVVGSTGQISTGAYAYANSGSARDIQAAVDWVAGHGGTGTVYIPEGTFNFVNVGEPWMTVYIPAGVNLFGAPTERDANGQVIEWKTILVEPYGVPGGDITDPSDPYYSQQSSPIKEWFVVDGNSDPNKPTRFSDIMLQGYRFTHPDWRGQTRALVINQVIDFRVDHSRFQDTPAGVWVGGNPNTQCRGVFDHNVFNNTNGLPYDPSYPMSGNDPAYAHRTVGYGIGMGLVGSSLWDPNPSNVWGKYETANAAGVVYIEDNYFSKWRHAACSGHGFYYVFRHNIINQDFAYGSIDCHGQYDVVGTRAVEVYDNQFLNPLKWTSDTNYWGIGMFDRGGAGLIYNNNVSLPYKYFVQLSIDGPQDPVQDTYIWGNNLDTGISLISNTAGYVEGKDYTIQTPTKQGNTYTLPALDGKSSIQYTPYPYPHPLTLQETR